MPKDPSRVGTGTRRQGDTEPDRSDDSRDAKERAIEQDQETAGRKHERGWEHGAHGKRGPHPEEKPGTRLDLDQADTEQDSE